MDEKKKQAIEEIASIICKETSNKGVCEKCDFKKHEQFGFTYQCSKFDNAEDIYNAGYRKGSDTAREILAQFIWRIVNDRLVGENYDLYYELLKTKDDLLKEKYGVGMGDIK